MIVAGVVIETQPGKAADVKAALDGLEGLRLEGTDGDSRLAAVWVSEDGKTLEKWAEELIHENESVVGVFPTFVGDDREDES